MIWNFDMLLANESRTWAEDQGTYVLWHKGSLHVHLQPRKAG